MMQVTVTIFRASLQLSTILYTTVYDTNEMDEFVDTMSERIKHECHINNCSSSHFVTSQQVKEAVGKLKSHKTDGSTERNSCHLIYSTSLLHDLPD